MNGASDDERNKALYREVLSEAQAEVDRAIANGGLTPCEIDIYLTEHICIRYLQWVHQARAALDRKSRLKLEEAVEMIEAIEVNNSRVEPVPDSWYFRYQLDVWNRERAANKGSSI